MPTQPTPTIWTVSPEYLAVTRRLKSLCDLEESIGAELKAIEDLRFEKSKHRPLSSSASHGAKDIIPANPGFKVSDAARRLLAEFASVAPEPTPPQPARVEYHDHNQQRAIDLCAQLANVREAIALLRPTWTRLHTEASRALCAAVAPAYDALATKWLAAAVALAEAQAGIDAFMAFHASSDLGHLRPISTDLHQVGGDPRDRYSGWRRMFVSAAENGRIQLADLPAALRSPATPYPTAALPAPDAPPSKGR